MATKPTLCLCVIAGREEIHIERMLRSFAPAFDLLSLVIAVGNQQPDETENIARRVCAELGKLILVDDYRNAPGCDWPHVDDFAAARNRSFEQAKQALVSNETWLFWADCDDTFLNDLTAFRDLVATSPRSVAWSFPYAIPNAGKVATRERLISHETWAAGARWTGAIHENLAMPNGTERKTCRAVEWVHEPLAEKAKDARRNLRILTRAVADAPTYFFYIAQEYAVAGNKPNLRKFGRIFLDMPNGDKSMRYQMHLYLAGIGDTHEERAHHALAAHWIYPECGEALASLVRCAMEEQDGKKAYCFAKRLMDEIPLPENPEWFHEPRWYGWAGQDLYARSLRMAWGEDNAENYLGGRRTGPPVPVAFILDNTDPAAAMEIRATWYARAKHPENIDWCFVLPADSPARKWLTGFRCVEERPVGYRFVSADSVPAVGWDA
jgi:hypothetical protein